MHDLDRTLDVRELEADFDGELDDEYDAEIDEASDDEFEAGYDDELEAELEMQDLDGPEGAFDEDEELELAMELLGVGDDAELDQFLGKLIRRAGRRVRRFARSSAGRALGGLLRRAAKRALPLVGRAAGRAIGGRAGGAIGGRLATAAGRAFGLELEGMDPEDQELEVARRFVRFAGAAARRTAMAPRGVPGPRAARAAVRSAARSHAPGLVRGRLGATSAAGFGRSGRWVRRGRRIILLGV